jgi:hypothetical protein
LVKLPDGLTKLRNELVGLVDFLHFLVSSTLSVSSDFSWGIIATNVITLIQHPATTAPLHRSLDFQNRKPAWMTSLRLDTVTSLLYCKLSQSTTHGRLESSWISSDHSEHSWRVPDRPPEFPFQTLPRSRRVPPNTTKRSSLPTRMVDGSM